MEKSNILEEIVNGITSFKIIPFFGAGMSLKAGALSWSQVIAELKRELTTTETDFLLIGSEYERAFGRAKLIEKLQQICALKIIDSNSLQNHLRILAMNPPIIYTTNYDEALEEASRLLSKEYKKIVTIKDIVNAPHGAQQIIKFHGDFSVPESIVFTGEDYNKRMDMTSHPLDITFRKDLLGKGLLFLGYGLSDINIKTILAKHKELYGTDNMPKSYIITFEANPKREQELKDNNIITLVLSSPDELSTLISNIGTQVFNTSINEDIKQLRKPLPSEVLAGFEIEQLCAFIDLENKTDREKHEKLRSVVDGKSLSIEDEDKIALLFQKIITGNYADELKNAVVLSFPHTQFRKTKNVLSTAFDLIALTGNPKFRFNFRDITGTNDVLMAIEMKLANAYNSQDARKILCAIILAFLEAMIVTSKKLEFDQVDRLLDALKNNGYEEFEIIGPKYTPEVIKSILNHYFNQLGNTLKARFEFPSMTGRGNNIAQITEQMLAAFPKDLL